MERTAQHKQPVSNSVGDFNGAWVGLFKKGSQNILDIKVSRISPACKILRLNASRRSSLTSTMYFLYF
jgi:hypothetical protein